MRCRGRPSSATTSRTTSRCSSVRPPPPRRRPWPSGRGRRAGAEGRRRGASRSGPTSTVSTPGALEQRAGGAGHDEAAARRASPRGRRPAARRRAGGWRGARRCRTSSSRATRASISSRPSGSRPAVGSSSSTSSGSPTMAWASLVRCRMPVEKPPMGRNRASSSPTRSSTSDARWRAARGGSPLSSPKVPTTSAARLVERQAVVLGHVPDLRADPDGVLLHVDAAHLETPRGGVAEPEHHPEQRGLAGAVGAHEPDAADGTSRSRWSVAVTEA